MNFYKSNCLKVSIFTICQLTLIFQSIYIYIKNNESYYLKPFLNPSEFLLASVVIRMNMLLTAMHLDIWR